jgi:hypothetical protein
LPPDGLRVLRRAAGLRAGDLRALVPDFAAAVRFGAALRAAGLAFALLAVERFAAGLRAGLRAEVDRDAPPLDADAEDEPELVLAMPSIENLPDITRWAASATASAISEPSFVALCIIDLAALSAVSAASMPASLIAFRAFGLAAIAAAAAVRPAASISLLIAPLAILFIVSFDFEVFEDDVRLLDFAIADLRFDFAL